MADWRDAFFPEPHVGVTEQSRSGAWVEWLTYFPKAEGLPGDPIADANPFTFRSYIARTIGLLRAMLFSTHTRKKPLLVAELSDTRPATIASIVAKMTHLLRIGTLSGAAALSEALGLLATVVRTLPLFPEKLVGRLLEAVVAAIRSRLEDLVAIEDGLQYKWEVIDLVLAFLTGCVRFRLMTDPRGLSAIDQYECRQWLRINGASERSLDSAFVRGLYDLALAYENGDAARPGLAAGQALRGSLRMFFTYRGALFWKMRSGMGDCVFAPILRGLAETARRALEFFHRLENLKLCPENELAPGERPYVQALEFDVQAEVKGGGEFQPLINVKGVPCWPSTPDLTQLVDGERLQQEGWRFESFWDRRKARSRTLTVTEDFDFVVLGISVGAIPFVCRGILARDSRWRDMVYQRVDRRDAGIPESECARTWPRWAGPKPPVTLSSLHQAVRYMGRYGACRFPKRTGRRHQALSLISVIFSPIPR